MTTALEIWQVMGFAIPLFSARIKIGLSAMNKRGASAPLLPTADTAGSESVPWHESSSKEKK